MDWNWACEQLLKGKKVKLPDYGIRTYLFLNIEGILCSNILGHEEEYAPCNREFLSTDWELYEEPKKWTEEDIRKAKAGIELGFKVVVRDESGVAFMSSWTQHEKSSPLLDGRGRWCIVNPPKEYMIIRVLGFASVNWEDEEPTPLSEIANSEVEE